jgi:hypothetical protein
MDHLLRSAPRTMPSLEALTPAPLGGSMLINIERDHGASKAIFVPGALADTSLVPDRRLDDVHRQN